MKLLTLVSQIQIKLGKFVMQIDKKFIAIEGPIGVSKTSLAKKLSNTLDYDFFLKNLLRIHF